MAEPARDGQPVRVALGPSEMVTDQRDWSPMRAARYLCAARGNPAALDPNVRVEMPSSPQQPGDYNWLVNCSANERSNVSQTTPDEAMKKWSDYLKNNKVVLKLMGVGDSEKITPEIQNRIESHLKTYFTEDYNVKIDQVIEDIKRAYQNKPDELKHDFAGLKMFCHMFGKVSGDALANSLLAETAVAGQSSDLIKQMADKINAPDEQDKGILDRLRALFQKSPAGENRPSHDAGPYVFEKAGHGLMKVSQDAATMVENDQIAAGVVYDGVSQDAFKNDGSEGLDREKVLAHRQVLEEALRIFKESLNGGASYQGAVEKANAFLAGKPLSETMSTAYRVKNKNGQDKLTFGTVADAGIVVVGDTVEWLSERSTEGGISEWIGKGKGEIQLKERSIPSSAVVILCSDGLYKNLGQERLDALLNNLKGKSREEVKQALQQAVDAIHGPGQDDASFVLL
ncbi:hypothetical protein HY214_03760 [Candidatus Roizmanbacteria bacterium]|nr:hypothetical protein [Candidatus Roizmanbacteria bacterium]